MLEQPKLDQRIKDVNHGIGIIKFVLHAHLDLFSKTENVLLLTHYAQLGMIKDYVLIALKDIKFKMEFV